MPAQAGRHPSACIRGSARGSNAPRVVALLGRGLAHREAEEAGCDLHLRSPLGARVSATDPLVSAPEGVSDLSLTEMVERCDAAGKVLFNVHSYMGQSCCSTRGVGKLVH